MSVAAGQLLAYLKIGALALGLMAAVGGVVKLIETPGRPESGGRDEPDGGAG